MQRWFVKSLSPIDALPSGETLASSAASKDTRTIQALGVPNPAFVKSAVPVPELEIAPLTTATFTLPATIPPLQKDAGRQPPPTPRIFNSPG